MNDLEVPQKLACESIETDQTLGEPVVAETVAAVPVVGRRADSEVDPAELLIDAHRRPDVGAASVGGRAAAPAPRGLRVLRTVSRRPVFLESVFLKAFFSKNRLEGPEELAASCVVAAHLARRHGGARGAVADRGADDDDIAVEDRWRRQADLARVEEARQTVTDRDPAVVSEGRVDLPCVGIDRDQLTGAGAEEDPTLLVALTAALPEGDAAMDEAPVGRSALPPGAGIEGPQSLACPRVDRRQLAQGGAGVEHSVHHQRRRLKAERAQLFVLFEDRRVDRFPEPGNLETPDIASVDEGKGRVARAARVATVERPLSELGV